MLNMVICFCRTSGLEVMKIGEEKTRLKSAAELAAEFRNKRLYGSGIPRETSKFRVYSNTFIITVYSQP